MGSQQNVDRLFIEPIPNARGNHLFSEQPLMRHGAHPVNHENEIVGASGRSVLSKLARIRPLGF
jgi:hypothetical protein